MAKSFFNHLAKVADQEIKRSLKEAEKRRKKEEQARLKAINKQARKEQEVFKRELRRVNKEIKFKEKKEEKERLRQEKKHKAETEKIRNRKQKVLDKINNYLQEAEVLYAAKDFSKSVKFCKKVLLLDIYNRPAYEQLIKSYHEMQDYESEENIIVEALSNYPNNAEYEDKLIQVARILTQ